MSDLEKAISLLPGHSIALVKGDQSLISDLKGIKPMMSFLQEGISLEGFSVADLVVGKAAASLFVKAGIKEVYAEVISESGSQLLKECHIPNQFKEKVPYIINRRGDGMCPMEMTVKDIDDIDEAYEALKKKIAEMHR